MRNIYAKEQFIRTVKGQNLFQQAHRSTQTEVQILIIMDVKYSLKKPQISKIALRYIAVHCTVASLAWGKIIALCDKVN